MIEIICDNCGRREELRLDGLGGVDLTLLRMYRWFMSSDKHLCSSCGVNFALRKRVKEKLISYAKSLDW